MVRFVLTTGDVIDDDSLLADQPADDLACEQVQALLTAHSVLKNLDLRCFRLISPDGEPIFEWQTVDKNATVLALTYSIADSAQEVTGIVTPLWGQRSGSRVGNELKRRLTPSQEQVWELVGNRTARLPEKSLRSCSKEEPPIINVDQMPFQAIARLAAALSRDKGANLVAAVREFDETNCLPPLADETDLATISAAVRELIPLSSIEHLCELGFVPEAVEWGLLENGFDEDAALNQLLCFCETEDGPPTTLTAALVEWQRWYKRYKPSVNTDPKLLQLIDMGFPPREARQKLRAAGGNVSDAAAALLGDPNALSRVARRQDDTKWFDPVLEAVETGEANGQAIIEVINKFMANRQCYWSLWSDPHLSREARLLAAIFEKRSLPD